MLEQIIRDRMKELDKEIEQAVENQERYTEHKEFWEKAEEQKIMTYMELKHILERAGVE